LEDEKNILITGYTEKEVFEAISQMEHNEAPGSNGFPAKFYKRFWDVIKHY
jgi:hypothetical protein